MGDRMIKKLPFEIISEKSDLAWIEANPVTHHVEYKDFLNDERKRCKAEALAKAGSMVLVKNGNELLGAVMPRAMLMIHQLLTGENTDGFFNLINNYVYKGKIGGGKGHDLLDNFDEGNQAYLVFDNTMEPVYGFVNPDFIKENLTTDENAKCMFKSDLSDRIVEGIFSWGDRYTEALDRLDKTRNDINANEINTRFDIVLRMEEFVDSTARFIYGVDEMIGTDAKQIFSLMSLEEAGGNQVVEGFHPKDI